MTVEIIQAIGQWIVIPCCLAVAAWRFFDFAKESL